MYMASLHDNRKSKRYNSAAKVRINNSDLTDILLKDLSITGCCLESTIHLDIKQGELNKIQIIPEKAAKIGKFGLIAKSVWMRGSGYSTEFGFFIVESPKGKLFQRYVDYLAWRAETASS